MGMRIYLAKLPFQFQHDGKGVQLLKELMQKNPAL
jgi:hypothetical protein